MQLINERGQLFGKVNLIDALVAVFVLLLIPLAYGAFLLFRVPAPTISAIEPTTVTQGEMATLKITGQDLRPFLQARLGTTESLGFLVQSPMQAEVKLPGLGVGVYDLALYDQGQELLRVSHALTVVASPVTRQVVVLRARFLARPEVASLVKVGDIDLGGPTGNVREGGAQLTEVDPNRETLTALTTVAGVEQVGGRTYDVRQTVTAFNASLRVPVVLTPTGWRYKDKPIKVGAAISFETITYFMDGWILAVRFEPESSPESR